MKRDEGYINFCLAERAAREELRMPKLKLMGAWVEPPTLPYRCEALGCWMLRDLTCTARRRVIRAERRTTGWDPYTSQFIDAIKCVECERWEETQLTRD